MDKVKVGEEQIVSMDAIAPGLNGLKITFVNVFGLRHEDGSWTLIDTALPFSAGRIKSWAEETFGRPPNAIVLTHGHFDHAGAAKELAEGWDIPVYAHLLEFPYLMGERSTRRRTGKRAGALCRCCRLPYREDLLIWARA